jgi:hypothetical protein
VASACMSVVVKYLRKKGGFVFRFRSRDKLRGVKFVKEDRHRDIMVP